MPYRAFFCVDGQSIPHESAHFMRASSSGGAWRKISPIVKKQMPASKIMVIFFILFVFRTIFCL